MYNLFKVDEQELISSGKSNTHFEQRLVVTGSSIGHNNWLGDIKNRQGQLAKRRPYFARENVTFNENGSDKVYEGSLWLVPFELILLINQDPESVTKEQFIELLDRNFNNQESEAGRIDFSYILNIPDQDFTEWKLKIAKFGISNNEAWGKNAIILAKFMGLDDSIPVDLVLLELVQMKELFSKFQQVDEISNLNKFLEENPVLLKTLIVAHHNWRKQTFEKEFSLSPQEEPLDALTQRFMIDYTGEEFTLYNDFLSILDNPSMFETLDEYKTAVQKHIKTFRDKLNQSSTVSSIASFRFMIIIAQDIKLMMEYSKSNAELLTILKSFEESMVNEVKLDANPAIVDTLFKVLNIQVEG